MQRQSHLGKPLEKSAVFAKKEKDGNFKLPTMKGNIGPTKKINLNLGEHGNTYVNQQKKLFSKMA